MRGELRRRKPRCIGTNEEVGLRECVEHELSGPALADDPADGRGVALLDYDLDGWVDLAVVNANAPLLQLFRNRIGELGDERPDEPPVIGVRFVGGTRESTSSDS